MCVGAPQTDSSLFVMKKRTKYILTCLMFAASLLLLGYSFLNYNVDRGPRRIGDPFVEENRRVLSEIKIDSLISTEIFSFNSPSGVAKGDSILAVFVLDSAVCPPCLVEISEFMTIMDTLRVARHQEAKIGVLTIILDPDRAVARRFQKIITLPGVTGSGFSEWLEDKLCQYRNRKVKPILAFIDVNREVVFYRLPISSGQTSIESKVAVLNNMMDARIDLSTDLGGI